jgi:hypothetical protein
LQLEKAELDEHASRLTIDDLGKKALHLTGNSLRSLPAGELHHYMAYIHQNNEWKDSQKYLQQNDPFREISYKQE